MPDVDGVEIDTHRDATKRVEGLAICALGDAAAGTIQGPIRHFRPELERRINQRRGEAEPVLLAAE